MLSDGLAYRAGNTPVHRCDARVKICCMLLFSLVLLFVGTWPALLVCTALVAVLSAVGRIPLRAMNRMLLPVYVLAGFSVLFNVVNAPGAEGLVSGLFQALRMVVLVAASFVVCLTTPSTELLEAFRKLIAPLRSLGVRVDDIAFTLCLAVRFIPVIEQEFLQIRCAQRARGAESAGSMRRKLACMGNAFAALFVGMFRHADALAQAMDARCYGAVGSRTRLPK